MYTNWQIQLAKVHLLQRSLFPDTSYLATICFNASAVRPVVRGSRRTALLEKRSTISAQKVHNVSKRSTILLAIQVPSIQ